MCHQFIKVVVSLIDMFLPTPDNLLVSLSECRDLIMDLLEKLPQRYQESYDTHSALGAALQAAYKLLVRELELLGPGLVYTCPRY